MTAKADTLKALHDAWCLLTGQELNYRSSERMFYDYDKAGFTEDDLKIVICGMQKNNARSDMKYRIQVHKVIGNLDTFSSILADMKPHRRPKPPTNREQVLSAFRKAPEQQKFEVAQSVKDILKTIIQ